MAFSGRPYPASRISLDQFKKERPDQYWPSLPSGLPVDKLENGQSPILKDDEAEDLPIKFESKSKMFELWKDEDREAFDRINSFFASKVYFCTFRHTEWNVDQKHLQVWMEWVEASHVIPESR